MVNINTRFIKVSYDLDPQAPIFEGNIPNDIDVIDSFDKGQSWNSYQLRISNHNGTHIDAPNHFDPNGKKIAEYPIAHFVFNNPLLFDLPKSAGQGIELDDLNILSITQRNCDLLLLKTGFCRKRKSPVYTKNNPWLTPAAARFLRSGFPKLRAIGLDLVSAASPRNPQAGGETHQILLQKGKFRSAPILIIEDLDLRHVPKNILRFFAIPLFVPKVDSMPCTSFVEIKK